MKTSLIAVALVAAFISACTSTPNAMTSQATPNEIEETNKQVGSPAKTEAGSSSLSGASSSNSAIALKGMQNKSVYFDFDESTIKPEYRELVQQNAEFMKSHSDAVITLEGSADERGSNEYNLALGGERASAVRKSLELMGVPGGQIKVVSLGDAKPRMTCHEERCWKENRRVDFIGK